MAEGDLSTAASRRAAREYSKRKAAEAQARVNATEASDRATEQNISAVQGAASAGIGVASKTTARKMVLVSMIALLAIAYYRGQKGEAQGSTYKRLWGVGVLGIFLSMLADFLPEIAGPFAVLVVLGSLTNGGDKALQQVLGKVAGNASLGGTGPTSFQQNRNAPDVTGTDVGTTTPPVQGAPGTIHTTTAPATGGTSK